jgi:polyisoprenoid-binding protein YceI
VVVALIVTAAVLVGGPYLLLDVILGKAPAKLALPPVPGAGTGPVVAGPVSGTWVVVPGSIAGYRVHELLFGQSHTAVGRTSRVTGGIVISGTEITAADFTVEMASVKSDQGARDFQFRGFIMETADYPHGSFRLTEPVQLGSVPAIGRTIQVPVTGDLTLRGHTRLVTFTLDAERTGSDGIDVNAEISIQFGLWHIPNPTFAVAKLGKTGTIEVLLKLAPAGSAAAKAKPATTTTTYVPGRF